MVLKTKLHREIEKQYACKKDSLKRAIEDLQLKHKQSKEEIKEMAQEADAYSKAHGNDFSAVFNLYVSCLNNPKPANK